MTPIIRRMRMRIRRMQTISQPRRQTAADATEGTRDRTRTPTDMQNGNVPGAWNFSFSASYNFDLHKIAYMNCSISRDLHCFTMTASFVPVGPYKSYNFHISVNSSLLQDLKYDKRSSLSNGVNWY